MNSNEGSLSGVDNYIDNMPGLVIISLVVGLIVIMAIVCVATVIREKYNYMIKLEEYKGMAQGEIIKCGERHLTRYKVSVSYTVDGRTHVIQTKLKSDKPFENGDKVTVKYSTVEPSLAIVTK